MRNMQMKSSATTAQRLAATYPSRHHASLQPLSDAESSHDQVTAGMVMTSPVITVTVADSLWDAWSLMSNCGVRHIAVIDGRHCVGVVDDRQLVAAWPQGPAAMQNTAVDHVLAPRIASVLPETHLNEVAAIMNGGGVDAVPVLSERGVLLGLLTAVDMVRAVARWGIHADPDERLGTDVGSSQAFVL